MTRAARGGADTAVAHPLSYTQEGIWLEHLLHPSCTRLNVVASRRLTAVSGGTVRTRLAGVAARHASLRTTFSRVEDGPRCTRPPSTSTTRRRGWLA
jgi:hypothetical protein